MATGIGEPERVAGQLVSPGYFGFLSAKAALGAFPAEAAHLEGALPQIVLSHDYWRNRLNAKPAIIGQTLRLDGKPYAIVAVAERDI